MMQNDENDDFYDDNDLNANINNDNDTFLMISNVCMLMTWRDDEFFG